MKSKIFFIVCTIAFKNYSNIIYNSQLAGHSSQISYEKVEKSMCTYLAMRDVPLLLEKYAKGSLLLDYGSGVGNSTGYLAQIGFNVCGVDINPHMMKIAQERFPMLEFKLIEKGSIPYASNSFDIIFSSFVLLEISNKKELENYFSEAKRVMKNGGIFIIISTNANTYARDWAAFSSNFPENNHLKSGGLVKTYLPDVDMTFIDYYWSQQDIEELFEKVGFKLLHSHFPLGNKVESFEWKDELYFSPYVIYVLQK